MVVVLAAVASLEIQNVILFEGGLNYLISFWWEMHGFLCRKNIFFETSF